MVSSDTLMVFLKDCFEEYLQTTKQQAKLRSIKGPQCLTSNSNNMAFTSTPYCYNNKTLHCPCPTQEHLNLIYAQLITPKFFF